LLLIGEIIYIIIDDNLEEKKKNSKIFNKTVSKNESKKVEKDNEIQNSERKVSIDKSQNLFNIPLFSQILTKNMFRLHPITSICHRSINNPIWLKLVFFISEILILFGFNAIFFKSKYIDMRMTENQRNSIVYPLIGEFGRIILSILCCMCVTLIARASSLVTEKEIELPKKHSKCTNKQHSKNESEENFKIENEKKFEDDKICKFKKNPLLGRIGSILILLGFVAVFWYYASAFCYIYRKTQTGWLIGGIWSVLLNWTIFAPVYIILISYIEEKNQSLADIMKKLFLF
jgi:hypothetical protein